MASECLQQARAQAYALVQASEKLAALELFSALIGIRLAAGADPVELAEELDGGLPASIRCELEAVVRLTPATLATLQVVIERESENLWKQIEQTRSASQSKQKAPKRRGFLADANDHAKVAGAALKFGKNGLPTSSRFASSLSVSKPSSPRI